MTPKSSRVSTDRPAPEAETQGEVSRSRYMRAVRARVAAEQMLEAKSRELYDANKRLEANAFNLEAEIARRTQELERARAEAVAASQAKTDFLATMSHEIRTPINGMLGMAQVLRDATSDPEQIEQIDVILNSGEVLVHIVNDILDLSKIEAGMMKLDCGPLDLGAVLQGCVALFRGPAEERGLTLTLDAPETIPSMKGDAHRIRQMLHNLVSNAIKFTEEGQVTVEVRMVPATAARWQLVDITIRDTGIGICEDRIKDLFAPFCQLDSSTERRFEGTGLGLAITRKFAQMMGGTVDVRSTAGVGSDFTLRLPLALANASESEVDTHGPTGHAAIIKARAPRVLVAEDNKVNRTVLRALLKGLDIDMVEVEDGRAALEALAQDAFDLLIFDIQMPQMSGLEALGRFRENCIRSGRPVPPSIAMSANAMTAQTRDYLSAGFDRAVPKPVRKAELLATIAELLDRSS